MSAHIRFHLVHYKQQETLIAAQDKQLSEDPKAACSHSGIHVSLSKPLSTLTKAAASRRTTVTLEIQ